MNREIKFRAWDKRGKKMQRVGSVHFYETHIEVYCPDALEQPYRNTSIELMQYTGITDKNGKEIYEGDIVSGRFGINKFVIPSEMKMLHTGGESNMSCYGWNFKGYDNTQLEVIGNIYENPELMKSV
jgi:hypothetical protein